MDKKPLNLFDIIVRFLAFLALLLCLILFGNKVLAGQASLYVWMAMGVLVLAIFARKGANDFVLFALIYASMVIASAFGYHLPAWWLWLPVVGYVGFNVIKGLVIGGGIFAFILIGRRQKKKTNEEVASILSQLHTPLDKPQDQPGFFEQHLPK